METVMLKITGEKIIPQITIPVASVILDLYILDLKIQIKELSGVDVGRQILKFNNEELMNDKTIADYGIKLSEDLVLEVIPLPGELEFKIRVNFCHQIGKFNVKETTSVAEMRNKVARHWGIPSKNATLYALGCIDMEDDDARLSAYHHFVDSQRLLQLVDFK